MKLVEVERKGRLLTRAEFGCLKGVYRINVTRGCEFKCVYCYARGYQWAPREDEVHLYHNLPEKLSRELDNARRRRPVNWVAFNTSSDSFQSHPRIQDIAYRTMESLLERGVGLTFLTKGKITDRFMKLFANHSHLVHARIGLVSTSDAYQQLFEPGAATVQERLDNITNLMEAGIQVEARIDPIIPFYTDDEESITALYQALAERGVRKVTLSYLHLRPAILDQLENELQPLVAKVLMSCFEAQTWSTVGSSTRSKLIPLGLRKRGYGRFLVLAKDFGIEPIVCSCKNPDVRESRLCSSGWAVQREAQSVGGCGRQLSLFPC
ncbi:MAG: radical SAM protein [Deltaproteobacteria bacterium]|nr:radical SAM protein [Deltaproteobacteria bacterium]MBW2137370.1 radical SAM protein [Deltaproteobacteria bacterium]